MQKARRFYTLFALAAIGIFALPVGIANFIFGYVLGDSPCTLCWGQRQSMIYIGVAVLFILRYGMRPRYLGMLLIMTAFGLWESFYHYGAHALEDIGQGFGVAIFGIHTQFWAEVVFWAVVLVLGVIFFFAPRPEGFAEEFASHGAKWRKLVGAPFLAFWVFFVVVSSNAIQAFVSTGPPPFWGQGDPVRFSFNPKYIIWSSESWDGFKVVQSFFGKRRTISEPDYPLTPASNFSFSQDAAGAPLELTQSLSIAGKKSIEFSTNAPAIDITYANGEYLISTQNHGFYVANSDLSLKDSFLLDPYFSATITDFAGASYVKDGVIRIMGSNKTLIDVKTQKSDDLIKGYANFIKGYDKFSADGWRNRLKTSRSKLNYIQSYANDGKYGYMATIPNGTYTRLFIIKQLNSDKGLEAEYTPELAANVKLKDGRKLDELYITGLAFNAGRLYAVSKAYNLLLVIDTKEQTITEVVGLPKEILNIQGITFVNDLPVVLSYENGKNMLYELR
ncbi:disulfide bond formation protein B [Campylobacter sp. 19-13652]|uniref:disulfide bond formation protein B n=1 Tax=Campylobacter sp. 19-13652 TaxID=2840180 RepID=UPI001C76E365|nr:disulfide bond formation protein B [Campylobacter sp. 19-13652]BCX80079.1 disulfide bond formation protein B [Campylobacter sp. 19-13652]